MTITPPAAHIGTERLMLEPLRIFHAAEMVKVLNPPDLYTFTGGEAPAFDKLIRRYTMLYAGSRHEKEQWHNWILRLRGPNVCIGYVQATLTGVGAEVAWLVGAPWQGQGYAQEATQAMCAWLNAHGVATLDAWIHPEHSASHGVAKPLGLVRTDTVDEDGEEKWSDHK